MSLGLSALVGLAESAIERIWPDPQQQAEELRKLEEMKQKKDLAELAAYVQSLTGQLKINAKEAEHKSIFVAGWRPFVGWVGGASMAYVAILEPLMRFVAAMLGYEGEFPEIDTSMTIQVLLGMLGIGAMRSYDKLQGKETKHIK